MYSNRTSHRYDCQPAGYQCVSCNGLRWTKHNPYSQRSKHLHMESFYSIDRKSVVEGKSVDLGGCRIIEYKRFKRMHRFNASNSNSKSASCSDSDNACRDLCRTICYSNSRWSKHIFLEPEIGRAHV